MLHLNHLQQALPEEAVTHQVTANHVPIQKQAITVHVVAVQKPTHVHPQGVQQNHTVFLQILQGTQRTEEVRELLPNRIVLLHLAKVPIPQTATEVAIQATTQVEAVQEVIQVEAVQGATQAGAVQEALLAEVAQEVLQETDDKNRIEVD